MTDSALQMDDTTEEGGHLAAANFALLDNTQRRTLSGEASTVVAPLKIPGPHPLAPRKVAIPRGRPVVTQGRGKRVSRACESCRIRKTKCSGETPVCRQCQEQQAACVYPLSARETVMRQKSGLSKKLRACQELLMEAKAFVPGRTAQKIQDILQDSDSGHVSNDISSATSFKIEDTEDRAEEDSSNASSSVRSLEALDEVEFDVNSTNQSRAAGNIGKSSEITWMQRLEKEAVQRNNTQGGAFAFDDADKDNVLSYQPYPHEFNFHLDDIEIGVSEPVQVYWMPPRPLADTLFNTYLRIAHPYLPIINRPLFCDQYQNFFNDFAIPGDKWLAILNMIFAIAASYAQKAGLEQHGDPRDHLLYLTRARILALSGDDVFRHPDLQQVQVEGLISFYLLSTDQIHRSWRISALAIRSAVSLGINLKNNGRSVTGISKETRNRLWWSLLIIENRLGLMTGRPTCVSVNMSSSPFPLPLSDEQLQSPTATKLLNDPSFRDKRLNNAMASSHIRQTSFERPTGEENMAESHAWLSSLPVTPELCFMYACDLTILMQEMSDHVYTVNSVHNTWQHLQGRINDLKSRVDSWFTYLPPSLDLAHIRDEDESKDERIRLACQYYSAQILLGRPCLCNPIKSRVTSNEEKRFSYVMAVSTVKHARKMAQLISEVSSGGQIFGISPWWSCLHYVMQAAAVLIIELSLNCVHVADEDKGSVMLLTKRCIWWLHQTSKKSLASHRAWKICDSSLRRLSSRIGLNVDDLPLHSSQQDQAVNTNEFNIPIGQDDLEPPEYSLMSDYNIYHTLGNSDQSEPMSSSTPFADFGTGNNLFPSGPLTEPSIGNLFPGPGDNS